MDLNDVAKAVVDAVRDENLDIIQGKTMTFEMRDEHGDLGTWEIELRLVRHPDGRQVLSGEEIEAIKAA